MQEQTPEQTQTSSAPRGEAQTANPMQLEQAEARQMYRCTNCDIEFSWPPTVAQGKTYCCTGCVAGGPCNCDYSLYRSVTIMGIVHYDR